MAAKKQIAARSSQCLVGRATSQSIVVSLMEDISEAHLIEAPQIGRQPTPPLVYVTEVVPLSLQAKQNLMDLLDNQAKAFVEHSVGVLNVENEIATARVNIEPLRGHRHSPSPPLKTMTSSRRHLLAWYHHSRRH